MQTIRNLRDGECMAAIRLAMVVGAGVLAAIVLTLHNSDGAWPRRLCAALLMALSPILFVWPRLLCRRATPALPAPAAAPAVSAPLPPPEPPQAFVLL